MKLSEAIEVLKTEKDVYDLCISRGCGDSQSEVFSEAVGVVLEFVDRCVALLMRM